MEPRTTNQAGEDALVRAGEEVGVQVAFYGHSSQPATSLEGVALMPTSGANMAHSFEPGLAGALMAGGFTLVMLAVLLKRRH